MCARTHPPPLLDCMEVTSFFLTALCSAHIWPRRQMFQSCAASATFGPRIPKPTSPARRKKMMASVFSSPILWAELSCHRLPSVLATHSFFIPPPPEKTKRRVQCIVRSASNQNFNTVLSRGVRPLSGPTRKSSPWGNFSDGGLNQSIKRRLSL